MELTKDYAMDHMLTNCAEVIEMDHDSLITACNSLGDQLLIDPVDLFHFIVDGSGIEGFELIAFGFLTEHGRALYKKFEEVYDLIKPTEDETSEADLLF